MNPSKTGGISIGNEFCEVVEQLRRVTVRIFDGATGCGSGVVWTSDGLIVTNAHVVQSRTQKIEFGDGRVFDGIVLGIDERLDLGAVQIDCRGLTPAERRDVRELRAGELVLAVGNPMGAFGAITSGIVHRKPGARELVLADMRLAPGYSGGPLADAAGRVIGINRMTVAGLGCAIPGNLVAAFLQAFATVEVA